MGNSVLRMNPLSFAALFCILGAAGAHAQTYEFSAVGGYTRLSHAPLGSIITNTEKKLNDTTLKGGNSYGVRVAINTRGYYGHVFGYIQTNGRLSTVVRTENEAGETVENTFTGKVKIREGFYNFLMYMMPRGEWWRPFVTVGAQTFNYGAPNFSEWPGGSWRNYGANLGGGIKFRASKLLLRLDFRDYIQGKPYGLEGPDFGSTGGIVHQLEGTVGIGFTF